MKSRKQIITTFLIILAIYNAIAFIIPTLRNTTFWIAYAFSNLSIFISGLIILGALDNKNVKGKFKSMPTVYFARTYLILQLIMGFVEIYYLMNFRYSILINVILLGISISGLSIIDAGKKEIERVDEKVKEKVFFIKELQTDIEIFTDKIKDEQTKKELNLLIDTIRFSDPMSHSKLALIENQINVKVQKLVQTADNEEINQICNELQQLFAERNKKAKLYKNEPEETETNQKPLNFKLIIAIIVSILVIIGIAVTIYFTIIIPNQQYNDAIKLYNNKQYIQAKEAFEALEDYKDSKEKQKEVMYTYANELLNKKDYANAAKEFAKLENYNDSEDKLKEAIYEEASVLLTNKEYAKAAEEFLKLNDYKDAKDKVIEIYNLFGEEDVIYFGKYKDKPIAWQILDTRDYKVLLITKEPIDEMAYNTEYKKTDWENSSIRKWLNGEFYNSFDEKEKARILKNTSQKDDIFLLSNEDVEKYSKLRNASIPWWLDSNGEDTTKAMYVLENGTINTNGDVVTKLHGVRPSIWLNLD